MRPGRVVSTGACVSIVVDKRAFLKGISYEELAAATGVLLRVVNFELDPDAVEILRQFRGFEAFNLMMEALSNIRPGAGHVDAPRCFGMKLDQAFTKFGAVSCVHDRHLRGHRAAINLLKSANASSEVDFICTDHVDDFKVGCHNGPFWKFIDCFEKVFVLDRAIATY